MSLGCWFIQRHGDLSCSSSVSLHCAGATPLSKYWKTLWGIWGLIRIFLTSLCLIVRKKANCTSILCHLYKNKIWTSGCRLLLLENPLSIHSLIVVTLCGERFEGWVALCRRLSELNKLTYSTLLMICTYWPAQARLPPELSWWSGPCCCLSWWICPSACHPPSPTYPGLHYTISGEMLFHNFQHVHWLGLCFFFKHPHQLLLVIPAMRHSLRLRCHQPSCSRTGHPGWSQCLWCGKCWTPWCGTCPRSARWWSSGCRALPACASWR